MPGDGFTGVIVCTRGRRALCSSCRRRPHEILCDGPAPAGTKRQTCDAKLCRACAIQVGIDRHLCSTCATRQEARR